MGLASLLNDSFLIKHLQGVFLKNMLVFASILACEQSSSLPLLGQFFDHFFAANCQPGTHEKHCSVRPVFKKGIATHGEFVSICVHLCLYVDFLCNRATSKIEDRKNTEEKKKIGGKRKSEIEGGDM